MCSCSVVGHQSSATHAPPLRATGPSPAAPPPAAHLARQHHSPPSDVVDLEWSLDPRLHLRHPSSPLSTAFRHPRPFRTLASPLPLGGLASADSPAPRRSHLAADICRQPADCLTRPQPSSIFTVRLHRSLAFPSPVRRRPWLQLATSRASSGSLPASAAYSTSLAAASSCALAARGASTTTIPSPSSSTASPRPRLPIHHQQLALHAQTLPSSAARAPCANPAIAISHELLHSLTSLTRSSIAFCHLFT